MINKVVIIGRLTRDPELRKTQSGLSVTSVTVAVDRQYKKDRQEGEASADFISCVVWRQPAEYLSKYAKKGTLVAVSGRLQTRSYEKDGRREFVTEVVADDVNVLEWAEDRKTAAASQYVYDAPDTYAEAKRQTDNVKNGWSAEGLEVSADDLPF